MRSGRVQKHGGVSTCSVGNREAYVKAVFVGGGLGRSSWDVTSEEVHHLEELSTGNVRDIPIHDGASSSAHEHGVRNLA